MTQLIDPPKGDCGRRAFNAGLRYCGLPVVGEPLRYGQEIVALARNYGLDVYDDPNKPYTCNDEPILVIYYDGRQATSDDFHAVFASDIAPLILLDRPLHTIIAGWEQLRTRVAAGVVPDPASAALVVDANLVRLIVNAVSLTVETVEGGCSLNVKRADELVREVLLDHCAAAATAVPVEQQTFKNTKEAMLYAQRNNIPAVVPVGDPSTSARE